MALARWSAGQAKTTTATAAAVQGTVGPAYTDLLKRKKKILKFEFYKVL